MPEGQNIKFQSVSPFLGFHKIIAHQFYLSNRLKKNYQSRSIAISTLSLSLSLPPFHSSHVSLAPPIHNPSSPLCDRTQIYAKN